MPANGHERTKLTAYILAEETYKDTTLEYSVLRPSDVIGTKMISRFLFALFSAVTRGRFCYFGPRGSTAACVHVADVARALIACGDVRSRALFNRCSDCLWEDLISEITRLVAVRGPRLSLSSLPSRAAFRALEGLVRLPFTSNRLASLTNRSTYSTTRFVQECEFTYSPPMFGGIYDIVKVLG
jgi:nucleoside-diphosphate-sugar epimerase